MEVTISLSNLIKSNYVAFKDNDKLIIDTNQNQRIIELEKQLEKVRAEQPESVDGFVGIIQELNPDVLTELDEEEVVNQIQDSEEESHVDTVTDEILNQTREDAMKLISEAQDEAIEIRESAKQEGFQQGYQEGIVRAEKEIEQRRLKFEQEKEEFFRNAITEQEQLCAAFEPQIVDVACQLIQKLTGIIVEQYKDVMLYVINNAIREVEDSKNFVIRVSDEVYHELESKQELLYGYANSTIEMTLLADAKLQGRQCMIETDQGILDIGIETQLEELITSLKLLSQG